MTIVSSFSPSVRNFCGSPNVDISRSQSKPPLQPSLLATAETTSAVAELGFFRINPLACLSPPPEFNFMVDRPVKQCKEPEQSSLKTVEKPASPLISEVEDLSNEVEEALNTFDGPNFKFNIDDVLEELQVINELDLLKLAEERRNISQACQEMGCSRRFFYTCKNRYKKREEATLQSIIAEETEKRVVEFSIENPAYGRNRVLEEMENQGFRITDYEVHKIWKEHNLQTGRKRFEAGLKTKIGDASTVEAPSSLRAPKRFTSEMTNMIKDLASQNLKFRTIRRALEKTFPERNFPESSVHSQIKIITKNKKKKNTLKSRALETAETINAVPGIKIFSTPAPSSLEPNLVDRPTKQCKEPEPSPLINEAKEADLQSIITEGTEKRVVEFSIENPAYGRERVSREMEKQGFFIKDKRIRVIWKRHKLETPEKRLEALKTKTRGASLLPKVRKNFTSKMTAMISEMVSQNLSLPMVRRALKKTFPERSFPKSSVRTQISGLKAKKNNTAKSQLPIAEDGMACATDRFQSLCG